MFDFEPTLYDSLFDMLDHFVKNCGNALFSCDNRG